MVLATRMVAPTNGAGNGNTNHENFRLWGKAISDMLAEVGMVKTNDTGQIDWATVTAPGGTNSDAGYEIWRFNDPQQGPAPIFFRISYGSGGFTPTPRVSLTVGQGSDGSGSITNPTSMGNMQNSSSSTTMGEVFVSYSQGSLVFAAWMAGPMTSPMGGFIIERSRNLDGSTNAHGFGAFFAPSGSSSVGVIRQVPGVVPRSSSWSTSALQVPLPTNDFVGVVEGQISAYPMFMHSDRLSAGFTGILFVPNGAIARGVEATIQMFGTARKYKGASSAGPAITPSNMMTINPIYRYE